MKYAVAIFITNRTNPMNEFSLKLTAQRVKQEISEIWQWNFFKMVFILYIAARWSQVEKFCLKKEEFSCLKIF